MKLFTKFITTIRLVVGVPVKQKLLVEKLYGCQLHYQVINIFANFLTDRKQFVTMSGLVSKMLSFGLGVIRGTVSGPRFFNYYINEIFTDKETTRHSSFADDTIIATAGYLDTGDESYQSLCPVLVWCQVYKLNLNTSKCRELLVQFGKGHVECLTKIPRCDSLKILGVHIDTKVGFKTHIENLSLKCTQLAFQINRLRKHAYSIREFRHIFNAAVLPHITFCVSLYGGVPKKHLKKLSSAVSLAKGLLHVTNDTDFYRNLQQSDCKMLRKIMETEKHILAYLIPLRQPYATEKLSGRPPPTNPVGSQNFNMFPDRYLRKEGL